MSDWIYDIETQFNNVSTLYQAEYHIKPIWDDLNISQCKHVFILKLRSRGACMRHKNITDKCCICIGSLTVYENM